MRRSFVLLSALALGACGDGAKNSGVDQGNNVLPDLVGVAPNADLTAPVVDLAGADLASANPGGSCLATPLLTSLGKTNILLGASMNASTAKKAPFDGRYMYLSGGLFDAATPCTSCASSCTSNGTTCANSGPGCSWWGCWQSDQDPPGGYARGFVDENQSNTYQSAPRPLLPMITYYEELHVSKLGEGAAQLAGLEDEAKLKRYLNDWRFLLQQIGDDTVLLHIEPDMWGYVEQAQNNGNPATKPPVAKANATDCASEPSTMTGFAQCLIKMVRKYAPNAKVGLHASPWGTNMDVVNNTNANLDIDGEAEKLATFMTSLGADDGDYLVVDVSDRDAGWDQKNGDDSWWDKTNATLPNFTQAFAWSKALAEHAQMPVIWWQIPVGNESLGDTNQKYRDNRVDYLLTHMSDVQAAHIVGLFFGGGMGENTTPETDGDNLVNRVKSAAFPACP